MKKLITIFLLLVTATSFAQPISGNAPVCEGNTMTLTDAASGGIWSSANMTVATIGSTSGVLTAVAAGTANITYATGSATVTAVVTVNPSPGAWSGLSYTLCVGGTTNMSMPPHPPAGGTWTSSNTAVETIGLTSGIVTGISAGTSRLTYTLPTGCWNSYSYLCRALPAPITGNIPLCPGDTLTLHDATSGGIWLHSGGSEITISMYTGYINAVFPGTGVVLYSTGYCSTSVTVTVNPLPYAGTITGPGDVVAGSSIVLTDSTPGGVWSSQNVSIATAGSGGVITGVSPGSDTILYTFTNSCGADHARKNIIVNTSAIGGITGPSVICIGTPMAYSNASTGGSWSSSNAAVATVDPSTGLVTGVSQGTVALTYILGPDTTVHFITVSSYPGPIQGNLTVCPFNTTYLSDTVFGGMWSSSNLAVGTVSPYGGGVRSMLSGSATVPAFVTISYTTLCGVATAVVTANPVPANFTYTPFELMCPGAVITCVDTTPGGFWHVVNPSVGTIDSVTGVFTALTAGNPGIYYTNSYNCSIGADLNVMPAIAPITGTSVLCVGGNTSLTDASTPGIWISSAPGIATVGSTGIVTGVSAGIATITFERYGSSSCSATLAVTVGATAGTITGTAATCIGGTTIFSDVVSGGIWSSSSPGVATVSSSGTVTGVAAGTSIISYTTTGSCGSGSATMVVTVSSGSVSAGAISGITQLCPGGTTTLTDAVAGGVWSTAASNVSVDGSGVVLGIANGVATISYTVSGACGTATATIVVTVSPGVTAGTITGGTLVCSSGSSQLTDAVSGGVWTSGTPGVATVSASGLVSGVSPGIAIISYTVSNSCGSSTATLIVTVSTGVGAGAITGTATVCTGSTTSLTDAVGGGSWSSSNTLVATAASTGFITGITSGTATIYYTVSNSCGTATATRVVTVNPSPSAGTINGTAVLCSSGTTSLSDAVAGGTWSSGSPAVATVGSTGIVSGVSAGTAVISYSITNSCGTTTAATRVVTVNAAPNSGTITGPVSVCGGATISLTDAAPGGLWTSSAPAIATVGGTTGIVTGVSFGTTTISYSVTNSCGTARATFTVTVTGSSAGTITGPSTVVTGTSIALTNAVSGGSWSASNGNATVSASGIVTGVSPGTVIISYTVVSGCGALTATKMITVSNVTSLSRISGYYFYLCAGATASFWNATTGGVWDISPASVATVTPTTGVVTGISAGTATLSYTYGGSTVTAVVTVYATPAAIAGASSICVGTTTALTDATGGGTWSSSVVSIATISTAGVVTGVMAGTTNIFYTGAAGCKASMVLTVTAGPSSIAGATSVCLGSSISVSDFTGGGAWSSTSGLSVVATGSATALATGVTLGTSTITYSLGGSCYRTFNVTVKPLPATILGSLSVCGIGAVTFLSDATSGVSWTIAPATVATVSPSGRVYGVSAGTANVTYTATNGCITSAIVTVNTAIAVAAITGPNNVSHLATITLSDITPGGSWSSSNSTIASVDASGVVTGVGTSGIATISYSVAYGSGCNAIATKPITVHTPAPPAHSSTTTVGAIIRFEDDMPAGDWTSSDNTIARVDDNGTVTALAAGNVQIIHTTAGAEGAANALITQLIVNPLPFEAEMIPNPNNGTFMIRGTIASNTDEAISIEITNMLGQVVYQNSCIAREGVLQEKILLSNNFGNGIYLLNVRSRNERRVLHFVIEK